MYSSDFFDGKKVTVMGLGVHGGGLGVATWLVRHGSKVTVTDMASPEKLAKSIQKLDQAAARAKNPVTYVLGRHRKSDFTRAHLVVRNPAVPQDNEYLLAARECGVPVESDISLLFLLCPHPIAAVTGTKGKSTVTHLLHAIASVHDPKAVMGGNVRVSPFTWLDKVIRSKSAMPIVLELSSWQLEDLEQHRLSPQIGVITNVMPDHLNRYDSFEHYAETKELAVAFQRFGDWAVLNSGDPWLKEVGEVGSAVALATDGGRRFWFGLKRPVGADGCFVVRGHIVIYDDGQRHDIMPVSEVKILGEHNLQNVLAAVSAAWAMGVSAATVRRVVRGFRGIPDRMEEVARIKGVTFVNDTTATMPDAAVAAMKTFGKGRNLVLICGGADKDLVFDECWAGAVARHAKTVVMFSGTATPKMIAALSEHAALVPVVSAASIGEAVALAVREAKRSDVVLLSPGCASFGLFANEFDRGEQFRQAVRKLK